MADEQAHWTEDPTQLWSYATGLEKQHSQRFALDKAGIRLYNPRPDLSSVERRTPTTGTQLGALSAFESFRKQGYNLTRDVIGGALAMIVRPIQIKILPVGADYKTRVACNQLGLLVDGVMDTNRMTELSQRVAADAMTCVFGALKVYVDGKSEIRLERVSALSLLWDQFEGEEPLTLIENHAIPRRRLMAEYPQHKKAIHDLPAWHPPAIPGVEYAPLAKPDTVQVIEATSVKVGDVMGRHVITCKGLILEDDDYEHEVHNIVVFRWENDFQNFGGVSLARGCAPYAAWSNKLVKVHYESLKAAIPVIWKHIDEETFQNISDLEYQVAKYDGAKPPEIAIAGSVSQDVVAQIASLRERCFQENGVSFQISTGQRPAGLNSAPAQREFLEHQNLRLMPHSLRWEQFYRDVAIRICLLASTAYKEKAARYRKGNLINEIKWKDINLKQDQYEVTAASASGLSLTISGKIDQLEVLKNLGQLDPDEVGEQLNLPDTEEKRRQNNSPRTLAEKQVASILEDGAYIAPSPIQDLNRALKIAKLEYQSALETETYPQAHTLLLRRYIRAVEYLLAPAPAPGPILPPPPVAPVNSYAAPIAPAPTSALPPL